MLMDFDDKVREWDLNTNLWANGDISIEAWMERIIEEGDSYMLG